MLNRVSAGPVEVKTFTSQTQADAVDIIHAYVHGWPYIRRLDSTLLDHWRTIPSFEPEHFWIAYRDGVPQACIHGTLATGSPRGRVNLLALRPGALPEAVNLLRTLSDLAAQMKLTHLVGPSPASALFYGGYVMGSEPYHPHWAVEATEAYVRAGYYITEAEVTMVRDLSKPVAVDAAPAGYEIVAAPDAGEYRARSLGYLALHEGQEIAHCYARLYPQLIGPSGGPVGQVGDVGTDEPHRGNGLARVMTQMCLRDMQGWGGAEVLLSTGLSNVSALRAYERAGFERRHHACEWTKAL